MVRMIHVPHALLRGDVPEERNDGERHPARHPDIWDRQHRLIKSREKDRRCTVQISAATEMMRMGRTVGYIDGITDAENTSSNDSQDRDDDSRLYFSGNW